MESEPSLVSDFHLDVDKLCLDEYLLFLIPFVKQIHQTRSHLAHLELVKSVIFLTFIFKEVFGVTEISTHNIQD